MGYYKIEEFLTVDGTRYRVTHFKKQKRGWFGFSKYVGELVATAQTFEGAQLAMDRDAVQRRGDVVKRVWYYDGDGLPSVNW